jgi:ATP-binding cassette subfamily B protein
MQPSNRQSERDHATLAGSIWPGARLDQALHALAGRAGLPATSVDDSPSPAQLPQDVTTWIEATAAQRGLQADQVTVVVGDIISFLSNAAPMLLRVETADGPGFLALAGARRGRVSIVGPDHRVRRIRLQTVRDVVCQPFEAQCSAGIDDAVQQMQISPRARARARAALLNERLNGLPFFGAYVIRLPIGSPVAAEAREIGLPGRLAALILTHVTQYLLFLVSWWLLGKGLLDGSVDRAWLSGWALLLLTLVPLRLLTSWLQGTIAVTGGAWLRRRLLRGAQRIDRQELRVAGPGRFFGVIVEAAAVESLALSGGVIALLAIVELALTAVVLAMGAGIAAGGVLIVWTGTALWGTWAYVRRRQAWTRQRVSMTDYLVQCMVGHRTRLAQQPARRRHVHEDESLHQYMQSGTAMDRVDLWLTAVVPRGWVVIAVAGILPVVAGVPSTARVAVTVGAVLLGYRALRRLSAGLSALAGAAIAGHAVLPLVRSASRADLPTPPALAIRRSRDESDAGDGLLAQIRDVGFRYRAGGQPVLQACTLDVPRRARVLLEGPSGSGKSTFASILAGLETPDSGLLLLNGLDRSVLRTAGWRSRVVLAPQAQENYLVGGTLAFNLLLGRRWPPQRADLAEAEQVCRDLGLGDLLERMPGGLQQIVGETGWQLSQGERARVFLARSLLQNPELLMLDESWGALDPENVERAIRAIAARAPAVIAIAHA